MTRFAAGVDDLARELRRGGFDGGAALLAFDCGFVLRPLDGVGRRDAAGSLAVDDDAPGRVGNVWTRLHFDFRRRQTSHAARCPPEVVPHISSDCKHRSHGRSWKIS
jgi:hypothetical protein